MKKTITALALLWLPCIQTATTGSTTTPTKKATTSIPASSKKEPMRKPTTKQVVSIGIATTDDSQPAARTLPLITVFNTTIGTASTPVVIKANCFTTHLGVNTYSTQTLETPNESRNTIINPSSIQILEVPFGTYELWAEEQTDFPGKKTDPIRFSLTQEAQVLTFSFVEAKPTLELVSLVKESLVTFYNKTAKDQKVAFITKKDLLGWSYASKQLLFNIPKNSMITLPIPVDATSFTIGTTTLPVPTVKTTYLITPKTAFDLADPVLTQLTPPAL